MGRRISFFVAAAFFITTVLVLLLLLSEVYGQPSEGGDESIAPGGGDESEQSTTPGLRWTKSLAMRTGCEINNPTDTQECDYKCRISDAQINGECRDGECDCYGPSSYGCVDTYTYDKFRIKIIPATAPWSILTSYDGPACESYRDDLQCDLKCRETTNAFIGKCRFSEIWETQRCFCCG